MSESIHKWSARQRGRTPVQALVPGADALVPVLPDTMLPPGSIIVSSEAVVHTEDYVEVARVWHRHPWCPVLLLGNQPPAAEDVALITPDGMRLHILSCGFIPDVAELRAAVRPSVPTPAQLAGYVGVRRGMEARWAILRALADPTLSRDLRLLGLAPPGEWRALFATVHCIGIAVAEGISETAAAERSDIQLKTLSRHCREHFGHSWPELKRLVHWEAMLETALRHKAMIPA